MSKQEQSVTILLENMQNSLDEKNKIIEELITQNESQNKQIELLQQRIDYLVRQKFISKSEKLSDGQLSLFEDLENKEVEIVEQEEIEITYTRAKGGKKRPPNHLPRVIKEHDLSEEEKICSCGCAMKVIGEEVTEQYDVIPATFQVIQHKRYKYACSCKCGVAPKLSPLTPQMLPKHQVSPSFLATIAVQKFEDHLPLYRQVKIYSSRFGCDEFSTTLFSRWLINASQRVLIYMITLLNEILMQSDYIQADETTLQVLNEPLNDEDLKKIKNKDDIVYRGKNKVPIRKPTSKSYIWVRATTTNNKIVLMDYSASRAMYNANKIFEGFIKGYLQTDGYPGYNDIANQPEIEQLGCWAHIRRKFTDTIKKISFRKTKELSSVVGLSHISIKYINIFAPLQVSTDTQILLNSPEIKSMEELIKILNKTILKLNDKKLEFKIYIKKHPKELKQLSVNFEDNIYLLNEKISSREIIKKIDLVITINSTVGLEAIELNKPCIVLGNAFYSIEPISFSANENNLVDKINEALNETDINLQQNFINYLKYSYQLPYNPYKILKYENNIHHKRFKENLI